MGTKRHLLVDARGVPLSLVVTGANPHDVIQLEIVLDRLIVARPEACPARPRGLCADKGYDYPSARQVITDRHYTAHVRLRGEERAERAANPGYRARRWVVEACHSWLNRFRKILVRLEKTDASHEALLRLACAIVVWHRVSPIYG